jgi:hypothetical protein
MHLNHDSLDLYEKLHTILISTPSPVLCMSQYFESLSALYFISRLFCNIRYEAYVKQICINL